MTLPKEIEYEQEIGALMGVLMIVEGNLQVRKSLLLPPCHRLGTIWRLFMGSVHDMFAF